jgi:hypothetical protein
MIRFDIKKCPVIWGDRVFFVAAAANGLAVLELRMVWVISSLLSRC